MTAHRGEAATWEAQRLAVLRVLSGTHPKLLRMQVRHHARRGRPRTADGWAMTALCCLWPMRIEVV